MANNQYTKDINGFINTIKLGVINMVTIKHTRESIELLERERDQFKQERNSLIVDVDKMGKEKNELKQHISELVHRNVELQNALYSEQLNQDEREYHTDRLSKKYKSLVNHIRHKAVANPSEHRYFRLVHFIDDLEGGLNE